MFVQLQSIFNFFNFYETIKNQKLSMKTAYQLARLSKIIDTELQFYKEEMQKILQEFGEMDKNGNLIFTDDGKGIKLRPGIENECYKAIKELQEVEVELPDIKFNIEDFGEVKLSSIEIESIIPFIKE